MKLSFFLLGLLAILWTEVISSSGDVITMSRDTTNPPDHTELHRIKRKSSMKSLSKKVGGKRPTKSGASIPSPPKRTPLIKKTNQHVQDFLTRLRMPKNNPAGKKFLAKFAEKLQDAYKGSASARSHLQSSLSTLLDVGNQGASLAASVAQVLALTKSTGTYTPTVYQRESDDLTPLLQALIRPVKQSNSGSGGIQNSVLVSFLAVCIGGLLSQTF